MAPGAAAGEGEPHGPRPLARPPARQAGRWVARAEQASRAAAARWVCEGPPRACGGSARARGPRGAGGDRGAHAARPAAAGRGRPENGRWRSAGALLEPWWPSVCVCVCARVRAGNKLDPYLSAWADTTEYYRVGGLNNRNLFFQCSGCWSCQIKRPAGLVSGEVSLSLACRRLLPSCCVLTWPFSLCTLGVSSSSYGDISSIGFWPHPLT